MNGKTIAVAMYAYVMICTSIVIDRRMQDCGDTFPTIGRVLLSALWPMALPASIFAPTCKKP
jgi:hypothetical protein